MFRKPALSDLVQLLGEYFADTHSMFELDPNINMLRDFYRTLKEKQTQRHLEAKENESKSNESESIEVYEDELSLEQFADLLKILSPQKKGYPSDSFFLNFKKSFKESIDAYNLLLPYREIFSEENFSWLLGRNYDLNKIANIIKLLQTNKELSHENFHSLLIWISCDDSLLDIVNDLLFQISQYHSLNEILKLISFSLLIHIGPYIPPNLIKEMNTKWLCESIEYHSESERAISQLKKINRLSPAREDMCCRYPLSAVVLADIIVTLELYGLIRLTSADEKLLIENLEHIDKIHQGIQIIFKHHNSHRSHVLSRENFELICRHPAALPDLAEQICNLECISNGVGNSTRYFFARTILHKYPQHSRYIVDVLNSLPSWKEHEINRYIDDIFQFPQYSVYLARILDLLRTKDMLTDKNWQLVLKNPVVISNIESVLSTIIHKGTMEVYFKYPLGDYFASLCENVVSLDKLLSHLINDHRVPTISESILKKLFDNIEALPEIEARLRATSENELFLSQETIDKIFESIKLDRLSSQKAQPIVLSFFASGKESKETKEEMLKPIVSNFS